jgi:hypothetical protein
MTSPNNYAELAKELRDYSNEIEVCSNWPGLMESLRKAADAIDAAEKMREANAWAMAILRETVENLSAEEGYSLTRITKVIEAMEPSMNSGELRLVPANPPAPPASDGGAGKMTPAWAGAKIDHSFLFAGTIVAPKNLATDEPYKFDIYVLGETVLFVHGDSTYGDDFSIAKVRDFAKTSPWRGYAAALKLIDSHRAKYAATEGKA